MKKIFVLLLIFKVVNCHSQVNIEIDKLFTSWINKESPGCVVGIIKDNKVIYAKSFGLANIDLKSPINDNTNFIIGSLTKQFVGYCVAILIKEGKLNLNDDVGLYLREFNNIKDTLRIKHLLYHTSGVYDYNEIMSVCGDSYSDFNSEQMIKEKVFAFKELRYKPGDKYEYNNSNYYLLAKIIEAVSGMSINEFAYKYIFGPLQMNHTYFFINSNSSNDVAISYSQDIFGRYQRQFSNTPPFGAGNLCSNINDLLKWEQNYYSNEISNLLTSRGVLNNGDSINYSFGLKLGKYKNYKTVYHFGDFNSYESVIVRVPAQRLSIIVMSNFKKSKTYLDNYAIAYKIIDLVANNIPSSSIPNNNFRPFASNASINKYIGKYKFQNGFTFVSFDGNNLNINHSYGDWYYSILPISDTVFCDEYDFEYFYKFNFDNNKVRLWTKHTGWMEKIGLDSITSISDFVGSYYSNELNTTYKLYTNNNFVYCKINDHESKEIITLDQDHLRMNKNLISVVRNLSRVEAIVVNNKYRFDRIK